MGVLGQIWVSIFLKILVSELKYAVFREECKIVKKWIFRFGPEPPFYNYFRATVANVDTIEV